MRTFIISGESQLLPAVVTIHGQGSAPILSGMVAAAQSIFDADNVLLKLSNDQLPEDKEGEVPCTRLSFPMDAAFVLEDGTEYTVSIDSCQPIVIGEPVDVTPPTLEDIIRAKQGMESVFDSLDEDFDGDKQIASELEVAYNYFTKLQQVATGKAPSLSPTDVFTWDNDVELTVSEIVAAERMEGFMYGDDNMTAKEFVSQLGLTVREWEKLKESKVNVFDQEPGFIQWIDRLVINDEQEEE